MDESKDRLVKVRVDRITDGAYRGKNSLATGNRKLATCKNLAARSESIPSRDRSKGRGCALFTEFRMRLESLQSPLYLFHSRERRMNRRRMVAVPWAWDTLEAMSPEYVNRDFERAFFLILLPSALYSSIFMLFSPFPVLTLKSNYPVMQTLNLSYGCSDFFRATRGPAGYLFGLKPFLRLLPPDSSTELRNLNFSKRFNKHFPALFRLKIKKNIYICICSISTKLITDIHHTRYI